jgi:hypothetical protein
MPGRLEKQAKANQGNEGRRKSVEQNGRWSASLLKEDSFTVGVLFFISNFLEFSGASCI